MRIIIVGGGIMGLSTAWAALRRDGHEPVVYEQAALPNPLGSSVDDHRLIRFAYGAMTGYARMVHDAYAAWERLWSDLGTRHYVETGTLAVARGDESWVRQSLACLDALAVPAERLAPNDIARRLPFLDLAQASFALFTPTGGVLFAERIVRDLLRWLRAEGTTVEEDAPVRSVDPGAAAVTLDDGRSDRGDGLIVAGGPWTARLVRDFGGRITPSRQVVVYLDPPADHLPVWQGAPMLLDQIEAERGGFFAVPPVGGTGFKIGDHGFSMRGHPSREREPTPEDVAAILKLASSRLSDFGRYRVTEAKTCFYSVAPGQRFIVEARGRALVLAGFSGHGFKFGPLVGEAVAETLAGRRSPDALALWAAGGPEGNGT